MKRKYILFMILFFMHSVMYGQQSLPQLVEEMKTAVGLVDKEMTYQQDEAFKKSMDKIIEHGDFDKQVLSSNEMTFLKSMLYHHELNSFDQKDASYLIDRMNSSLSVYTDDQCSLSLEYQDGQPVRKAQFFKEECFLQAPQTHAAKTVKDLAISMQACDDCVKSNRIKILEAYERKFGVADVHDGQSSLQHLFKEMKDKVGTSACHDRTQEETSFFKDVLVKMEQHPNFNKPVLSNDQINDLRFMMLRNFPNSKSIINYDDPLWMPFLAVYDAQVGEREGSLLGIISEQHDKEIGIKSRPNRGMPPYLDEYRCFLHADLNYPVGYTPNKGDEDVTAKQLFDVYQACIASVAKNRERVKQEYDLLSKNNGSKKK